MDKIHVTAKRDHLESLTTVKRPLDAVAQLVWNGLDALSDRVQVLFDTNGLGGLESIRIRDFGSGIPHNEAAKFFGNLGDSWKKERRRQNGRSLHGKNGKGRFKAFGLGNIVEWNTTYRDNGSVYSYSITGRLDALDDFESTAPQKVRHTQTGTEVVISHLARNFRSLLDDDAPLDIARLFAAYLNQYPDVSIDYNGTRVSPEAVQGHKGDYILNDIVLESGVNVSASVTIVEWTIPTKRAIHLCDANGVALHDVEAGQQIRAKGFHFTAYVKCDHFRELDKDNNLELEELHPDVDTILKASKGKINEHFRRRLADEHSKVVERWKEEQIYPYEDKSALDPVEEAERQVFDILAVNVQSYLPSFEESDTKSKRFTFRLLAQAVRENPDSVQEIVSEVLGLKKEEQDNLAELLRKTPLSSIISSAQVVANRLDFLIALENLIFDKETRKVLLERDQLHKILEKEAWLFDEDFYLTASEQRLEDVLQKHIGELGVRASKEEQVLLPDGKSGRIDLMLSKVVQPRTGEKDYLIVELKRPSKKIDADVITQIKKYAMAVASDERFHSEKARWKFVAVSNQLDDYAKKEAQGQRDRPRGLIYNDKDLNITVWIKDWCEVISDARARLQFINSQLSYEADRDSARSYLQKTHAKFIPTGTEVQEEAGNES